MRLITLNTWGGRAGKEGLLSFLASHKDSTDIFCLQEIWSAPYPNHEGNLAGGKQIDHSQIMVHGLQEACAVLSSHVPYFRPHHGDHYGLLLLVRKGTKVLDEGEVFVYKHKGYVPEGDIGNHARNIQYATLEADGRAVTVVNFHGLWNGRGKTDSDDRLLQSQNIISFTSSSKVPLIMAGDFNLLPDTQSLKMLEESGLKNLVKQYGITSTRTSHYTKPEKFADYVLVSPGVKILDFKVLPDEVSDHSPLLVDFEV